MLGGGSEEKKKKRGSLREGSKGGQQGRAGMMARWMDEGMYSSVSLFHYIHVNAAGYVCAFVCASVCLCVLATHPPTSLTSPPLSPSLISRPDIRQASLPSHRFFTASFDSSSHASLCLSLQLNPHAEGNLILWPLIKRGRGRIRGDDRPCDRHLILLENHFN